MAQNYSRPFEWYRKTKVLFNSLLTGLIQRCNAVLVKENPQPSSLILKMARFIGTVALLLVDIPRMEAYQFLIGSNRVIFVGEEYRAKILQRSFVNHVESEPQPLGRVSTLQLPEMARQWFLEDAMMVVSEISPLYPRKFRLPYVVKSPILVRQELVLPEKLEDFLNQPHLRRIRRQLNRAQRAGFTYRFSRERQDFDFYYYHMYLPYIQRRFGEAAFLGTAEDQWEECSRGGLILVNQDGKTVAGMLVALRGETCAYLDAGVLNADEELLEQGVFSFNLWSLIQWGHQHGARRVDLGGSIPWCSDGVFQYKNNWGAGIHPFRFIHKNLTYCLQDPPNDFLQLLNEKGILLEHSNQYVRAFFSQQPISRGEIAEDALLEKAGESGLAGVVVLSPYQTSYHSKR